MQKKTSGEVHDKHYQYYRYFVYFPFDVLNQNISYHVSAEMIPIIDNRYALSRTHVVISLFSNMKL